MHRFVVAGQSMEPALQDGDRLWCRRLTTVPPRGTIVLFHHPLVPDFWLIKRVIGLPGERVTIDLGDVLIDAHTGIDIWAQGPTLPDRDSEVGAGEVFVLSDNRNATLDDGRRFGPVSIKEMLVPIRRSRRHR